MKKGAVLLLLLLPVILVACGGVSATQVERDLYANLDKGDVAGALALTTEDVVFDIPGCPEGGCKGKDAVKGAFERVVAQHPRHTVKSSKASGNTATSQVEDELDLAKAAGVQRVVLKVNLEVKGGKIVRYRAQFDTSDPQTATVVNFRRLSGIYRQLNDAANNGDIPTAMANYADDAEFRGGATCRPDPCVGKAAIQKHFEGRVASRSQVNPIDIQVSGDTVTTRVEVRSDSTRAAGVERIVNKGTVTFRGDKITRHVIESDRSDPQTATFHNFQQVSGLHRQFVDAVARGDVSGALALFNDDAVIEGRGVCAPTPCVGKEAIRKEVERVVNAHSTATLTNVRVSGNATTARVAVQSDATRAAGVERLVGDQTLEERGGKIAAIGFKIDASDQQTATFQNFTRLAGLYRRYEDTLNRGDLTAALALWTEDGDFGGVGLCPATKPCVGKAAIQKQLERGMAAKRRFDIKSLRVSGNAVTGHGEFRGSPVAQAGVERTIVKFTATFRDDKIARLAVEDDPTDPQTATFANFQRLSGILRQHIDAINREDVAGGLATLTDDAEYVRGIRCRAETACKGKEAIKRDALEFDGRFKNRYNIVKLEVSGNKVTARVEYRGAGTRDSGIERAIDIHTAIFQGDKISRYNTEPDLSDAQTATLENFRRVAAIVVRQTDAINRGDVAGVMAIFTDDAVYEGLGLCVPASCTGKVVVQKEIERQVADKIRITRVLGTFRVSGNTASIRAEIQSDSIKAAGVERIIVSGTTEVKGAKISSILYALDSSDAQTATYLKGQAK